MTVTTITKSYTCPFCSNEFDTEPYASYIRCSSCNRRFENSKKETRPSKDAPPKVASPQIKKSNYPNEFIELIEEMNNKIQEDTIKLHNNQDKIINKIDSIQKIINIEKSKLWQTRERRNRIKDLQKKVKLLEEEQRLDLQERLADREIDEEILRSFQA